MKNRLITGVLFIVFGFFIAVGPVTIFSVCGVHTNEQSDLYGIDKENEQNMSNDSHEADSMKEADESNVSLKANTMKMKCFWTARTELGIGILILILGVLIIVIKSALIRFGLNISLALIGIYAILIPNVLIGVCGGKHMSCRLLTLPALSILGIAVIITAIVNGVYLLNVEKKNKEAKKRQVG